MAIPLPDPVAIQVAQIGSGADPDRLFTARERALREGASALARDWMLGAARRSLAGDSPRLELPVTRGGRTLAQIELTLTAEGLVHAIRPMPTPFTFGSRLLGLIGNLSAVALFGVWVWDTFWNGGLGRCWERISHLSGTPGAATKLELFYICVAGWFVVPFLAWICCGMLGESIDDRVNRPRFAGLVARIQAELVPWLTSVAVVRADPPTHSE